jgi:hypothetical protein
VVAGVFSLAERSSRGSNWAALHCHIWYQGARRSSTSWVRSRRPRHNKGGHFPALPTARRLKAQSQSLTLLREPRTARWNVSCGRDEQYRCQLRWFHLEQVPSREVSSRGKNASQVGRRKRLRAGSKLPTGFTRSRIKLGIWTDPPDHGLQHNGAQQGCCPSPGAL